MKSFSVTIPLLREVEIGKNKVSVSAQTFYEGRDYHVRSELAKMVKGHIGLHIKKNGSPNFTFKKPVLLIVEVNAAKQTYDLDNTSYIWTKAFLDAIKRPKVFVESGQRKGQIRKHPEVAYIPTPLVESDNVMYIPAILSIMGPKRDDTIKFTLVENARQSLVKRIMDSISSFIASLTE